MPSGRRVTILYEDQRGQKNNFGLHRLIVACVFDEVDGERHRLEKLLEERPLKGNTKVLKTIREDIGGISHDGHPVVALFDNDKVRRLIGLEKDAADEEVIEALVAECPESQRSTLGIVLLKENTETVIEQLEQAGLNVGRDLIQRALGKEMGARDIMLVRASRDRNVREKVLEMNESLRDLVKRLSCWMRMVLVTGGCSQVT